MVKAFQSVALATSFTKICWGANGGGFKIFSTIFVDGFVDKWPAMIGAEKENSPRIHL